MIAEDNNGIMVLVKRKYLIDMMNYNCDAKVKVTIRFFNLIDQVIYATDKTEIELDDKVSKSKLFKKNQLQLHLYHYKFTT